MKNESESQTANLPIQGGPRGLSTDPSQESVAMNLRAEQFPRLQRGGRTPGGGQGVAASRPRSQARGSDRRASGGRQGERGHAGPRRSGGAFPLR